ncbi:MAG TPA: hypothetical protein VKM93_18085 [Terriglobia bacterium]|nr:hypothetical protein [Terriglobia bacterium]
MNPTTKHKKSKSQRCRFIANSLKIPSASPEALGEKTNLHEPPLDHQTSGSVKSPSRRIDGLVSWMHASDKGLDARIESLKERKEQATSSSMAQWPNGVLT